MKTIAVIGPDEAEAKKVAEQLTGVRAVPGAGPGKDIDGVVAVAGDPTEEAVEIVQAVARNIGVVAVLSDHRWPNIPGVHVLSSQDVAGLQRLIDRLYVDTKQWELAARRADQQRLEQARVAIRLRMQRFIREGCSVADLGEPGSGGRELVHRRFLAELRVAVLSQGILCPPVDTALPPAAKPVEVPGRAAQLATLAAGVLGVVGLLFAVGRLAGYPWLGLSLGLLAAVALGWFRLSAQQRAIDQAQREADFRMLQEAWGAQVTETITRMNIPRVAEQLALRTGA